MSFYQCLEELGLPVGNSRITVCVLAEVTNEHNLLSQLEFHDVVHQPLWRLDNQAGLETYSPWLFQPQRDSRFDLWLGKAFPKFPLTVVLSRLSVDALWQHIRRLSKFSEGNRRYFLRTGDPGSLHLYTASIAHTPPAVERLFARGQIEEFFFHDPSKELACRAQPLFEQKRSANTQCDGALVWINVLTGGKG